MTLRSNSKREFILKAYLIVLFRKSRFSYLMLAALFRYKLEFKFSLQEWSGQKQVLNSRSDHGPRRIVFFFSLNHKTRNARANKQFKLILNSERSLFHGERITSGLLQHTVNNCSL